MTAEISFWEHARYLSKDQDFAKAVRRSFWRSLELGASTRCDCYGLGRARRLEVRLFVGLVHQVHSAFFSNPVYEVLRTILQ